MVVDKRQHFRQGSTRFHKKTFPEKDDLVVVKILQVTDMGAYCVLLEYDNLEGMILMSELSKRRVRSVRKIVRVGRIEVVLVLRVDKEKGYIDLSKKRVSSEDVVKCEERYSRSKKVHQVMYHVAQKHKYPLEKLNEEITWVLATKFDHPLDAFRDPEFKTNILPTLNIPNDLEETLLNVIEMRLSSQKLRMRIRIALYCYGYDGVDAVRTALMKGKEVLSTDSDDQEVEIKLIAPPEYIIIISCRDRVDGETRLTAGIKEMLQVIRTYDGGDGAQQGTFTLIGGEDEHIADKEGSDSGESDSSEEEESEEEDETMGRADQLEELGIPDEETIAHKKADRES